MSKLKLSLEGDTVVIVERRFAAAPEAVYRAHMDPALIRQWMLGPPGWRMTECINEGRAGTKIRYAWASDEGAGFHLTGEFLEVEPPHRTVHVERMHLPDPTPDNRIETTFAADGEGTLMTMRMNLPDEATRRMMLETGMEHGMEVSYVRLEDTLLAG
ncbi:MAG: SRPBCC domain-containing protein [Myxococcales bacterium]|nr:SRPBCC domain-containing protein [Myxococcales bacterium]